MTWIAFKFKLILVAGMLPLGLSAGIRW